MCHDPPTKHPWHQSEAQLWKINSQNFTGAVELKVKDKVEGGRAPGKVAGSRGQEAVGPPNLSPGRI